MKRGNGKPGGGTTVRPTEERFVSEKQAAREDKLDEAFGRKPTAPKAKVTLPGLKFMKDK